MNSDHIRSRFGSYGVDILAQTHSHRLANLFSEHAGRAICRTLALTRFLLPLDAALSEADRQIRAGASIGATLRSGGWRVIRSDAVVATAVSGAAFETLTAGDVPAGTTLALQVYTLHASHDDQRLSYAVIAEAYHPEHIAVQDNPGMAQNRLGGLSGEAREALEQLVAAL